MGELVIFSYNNVKPILIFFSRIHRSSFKFHFASRLLIKSIYYKLFLRFRLKPLN